VFYVFDRHRDSAFAILSTHFFFFIIPRMHIQIHRRRNRRISEDYRHGLIITLTLDASRGKAMAQGMKPNLGNLQFGKDTHTIIDRAQFDAHPVLSRGMNQVPLPTPSLPAVSLRLPEGTPPRQPRGGISVSTRSTGDPGCPFPVTSS